MSRKKESGLCLALRLITVSLEPDSLTNKTIRKGMVELLRQKMSSVTFIDREEVPTLMRHINTFAAKEPKVAEEVKQLIKKFHPDFNF